MKLNTIENIDQIEHIENEIEHIHPYNNEESNDYIENIPPIFKPFEIVESYSKDQNYFYLNESTIKIQSSFRKHLSRKKYVQMKLNQIQKLEQSLLSNNNKSYLHSDFSTSPKTKRDNNNIVNYSTIKGCYFMRKDNYIVYPQTKLNNNKNGKCILKYENDNSYFISTFYNNNANGIGYFSQNNNKYTFLGKYTDNHPFGYGIYEELYDDNTLLLSTEGVFYNNNLTGIGFTKKNNKILYEGEYVNCKKHGIGIYYWDDGTRYAGEWNCEHMNGVGEIQFANGGIYEGSVVNGLMDGFGMFKWKDGKEYIGSYNKGIKEGFGIFIWDRSCYQVYLGFWKEGKMNGIGMKISNKKYKVGMWEEGQKKRWLNKKDEIKQKVEEMFEGNESTEGRGVNKEQWVRKEFCMKLFTMRDDYEIKEFINKFFKVL